MNKKIKIILLSVVGLGFFSFCSASTIFSDNFESYKPWTGLNHQNGWVGSPSVTVTPTNFKEGTQAVMMTNVASFYQEIQRSGNLVNNGQLTIYLRRSLGGSSSPFFEIFLKEGGSERIKFKTFGLNFYYWDGSNFIKFGPEFSNNIWRALQIQWRSSDHKVRYNIDGGTWTPWVPPLSEWSSGLDTIKIKGWDGTLFFDAIQEKLIGQEKNPVLIVPGIVGTEMWNEDEHIWANLLKMADPTDLGDYFITESLSQDESGGSFKNILVKKVIERIFRVPLLDVNIFEDLRLDLENKSNYDLDKDLFLYPYDWRLDLNVTKNVLKQKIDDIKLQTGASKVDVIAHSMGGLLVKAYIEEYGKDSINKLIFVGTPHLGAPKSGRALLEGDNFSIPWLNKERVEELAKNMPSLHQLLPNQTYFNEFQGYIKPFKFLGDSPFYDYGQTKDYFINDKDKNPIMFSKAEDFFSTNLDNLDLSGMDAYNIAGCRSSTQAAYGLTIFGNIGYFAYTSGDGTVPLISADYSSSSEKYYVKNGSHAELPSTNGVRELILDILGDKEPTLQDNISQSFDFCKFKGKSLTWRSPVQVHIYDQLGNHTGPIDGGIEYGIANVDYEIVDGEKFVFLPTDDNQEYIVDGIGEDYGTFDLLVSEIDNGSLLSTLVYNDVPIETSSKINFDISNSSDDTTINYDFENSGEFSEIEADSSLDGEQANDLVPPQTKVVLTGKKHPEGSFISDVLVSLDAADNLSGVLETWYSLDGEAFQKYVEPFVLDRRNVYNLYYYSVDKAGNNEDTSVLLIQVGIVDAQYEKCWQAGTCSKFLTAGEKITD